MRFAYNPLINNLDLVGITSVEDDPNPTLGGDLDVNGYSIISTNNGDIVLSPDGTGRVILDGLQYPDTDGTSGQVITTDGFGNLSFSSVGGSGDVVGPASSIDEDIAVFDGLTGKIIKDGGAKIVDLLTKAGNLSGLTNTVTARSNLGLGTISTQNTPLVETLGGTNQTTYATGDILLASGANTLGKLSIPSNVPMNIGRALGFTGTTLQYLLQNQQPNFFDDFIANQPTSALGWGNNTANSGTVAFTAGTASHPGIITLSTSNTTNGSCNLRLGITSFLFGGGRIITTWAVFIPLLSTVTDTYLLRCGFGDSTLGADHVDGAYFEYTDTGATPNWVIKTANNSVRTTQTSNTAVSTGWNYLTIDANAAGTSIAFYVNAVQLNVSPLITNIPTGTGREFGPTINLIKSAGTTIINIAVDYFMGQLLLTTARQ